MPKFTDHQRYVSQKHNGHSPHTCEDGCPQKTGGGEAVEEREPWYTLDGKVRNYGKQHRLNLKTELPREPTFPLT